ncbi:hypothetical protein HDV00_011161 [Rhizophlyctis rosea]|nr:hypothetical protein HDV00_011161 [Rhizophlyctis rosea]
MGCCCSIYPEPPHPYRRISSGSTVPIETLIPVHPTPDPLRLVVTSGSTINGTINTPWLNLELWVHSGSKVKFQGSVGNVSVMCLSSGSTVDLKGVEYGGLFMEGDVAGGSVLSVGKVVRRDEGTQGLHAGGVGNFGVASGSGAPPQYEESVSLMDRKK